VFSTSCTGEQTNTRTVPSRKHETIAFINVASWPFTNVQLSDNWVEAEKQQDERQASMRKRREEKEANQLNVLFPALARAIGKILDSFPRLSYIFKILSFHMRLPVCLLVTCVHSTQHGV